MIICLLGESGTGKTQLAEQLAEMLKLKPFVAANVAGFTETLFESEVFGHVAGAFTGATGARDGVVTRASGGVLLLDEIGALTMGAQVRLLRLLGSRRYTPVGGRTEKEVDCMIIVATCADLRAKVAAGTFREDLYYRVMGYPLILSPLRDRSDDVAPLVEMFAKGREVEARAVELLTAHPWNGGNIRSLQHVVERLAIDHGRISTRDVRLVLEGLEAPPATAEDTPQPATPAERRQLALDIVVEEGFVTTRLLAERACCAPTQALETIRSLVEKKVLRRVGKGRGTRYVLT